MDSRDSVSDDEFDGPNTGATILTYDDEQLRDSALYRLNTLRKGGYFCDVTIEVGSHTISAHRAILACSSVFLYEAFSDEDYGRQPHIKFKNFDYESFRILIDYIYTARLEIPADKVKSVYRTALFLKMDRAAEACANFMVEHLTPSNCLGTRSFANSHSNESLTSKTDEYISNNINSVLNNSEIHKFPHLQVKVMGVNDIQDFEELEMCNLVVKFFRRLMEEDTDLSLDGLLENPKVLYLRPGNHLVDCMEVSDPDIDQSDIVTDYKKKGKYQKQPIPNKELRKSVSSNGLSSHLSGFNLGVERMASQEKEWYIIATKVVTAKRVTAISMLGDQLSTLSIKFYPQPTRPPSPEEQVEIESPVCSPVHPGGEKTVALHPLSRMSSARCAFGTAVIGDKLVVLGGYDRGECLNTVEMYDLEANKWTDLPPMSTPRGRFDVSQIQGQLFACGGSDGSDELQSVECYDIEDRRWTSLPDMSTSRSSAGVAVLDDKLFVVGGWSGFTGLKSCEFFDPKTEKWTTFASLNTGRSQCAVCTFQGKLVAIGGCDAWNSTNSVEVYNPDTQKWAFLTPMNCSRRGAGVIVFQDKMYVIGGSDGQSSLSSVEIYDPVTMMWTTGPSLTTPRANVAATVVNGKLFALGGFSGKMFLDTIEYFDEDIWEWSGFVQPPYGSNGVGNGYHDVTNGCNGVGDSGDGFGHLLQNALHNDHCDVLENGIEA